MQAIVYRKNGPPDVLTCEEMEKPSPGASGGVGTFAVQLAKI